ncbi:hypothetical protein OHR68_03725 [Spirillospora sp. NBC_00431]
MAVICEGIDRVARRTYVGTKIEYELEQNGVPLLAANEPILPDSGNGRRARKRAAPILTRRINQAIAEWYVEQMLELSWDGLQTLRRRRHRPRLRQSIQRRFAELNTTRRTKQAELDRINADTPPAGDDTDLPDLNPQFRLKLSKLPENLERQLYDAFQHPLQTGPATRPRSV